MRTFRAVALIALTAIVLIVIALIACQPADSGPVKATARPWRPAVIILPPVGFILVQQAPKGPVDASQPTSDPLMTATNTPTPPPDAPTLP